MFYQSDLIVNHDNRQIAVDYLTSHGFSPATLAVMALNKLANTYHEHGSTDIRKITADAVAATLRAMQGYSPPVIIDDRLTHYATDLVCKVVNLGHPAMLVGPAGCGKTVIGRDVAEMLNLSFLITGTVNDTHELIGFVDGYGQYRTTPFRQAFEHGGMWVADEIDAWDAAALLAANSALANGFCAFPDSPMPVERHEKFRMVATANTYGTGASRIYVGRNELDAASLDRFAVIDVNYDLEIERSLAGKNQKWLEFVWKVRKAVERKQMRHVVSSRAILMGAAALAAGIPRDTVEKLYLFKGMSENDVRLVR